MRLRLLPVLALGLLFAPVCHAQTAGNTTPSAASLALATKLIDLTANQTTTLATIQSGFKPTLDQMKSHGVPQELVDQIQQASNQFFAANFNWTTLEPQIAQLYASSFTDQELTALIAFYSSAAGQKAAALMPKLYQQSLIVALNDIKPKLPDLQQKVVGMMQAYQAAHTPPPSPSSSLLTPSSSMGAPSGGGGSSLLNSSPVIGPGGSATPSN
jgi:hypothetical protein